jgi:hypothetical protein
MTAPSGIVARPQWGFSGPGHRREVHVRLVAQARFRHRAEIKAASFWRRLWLEFALRREVGAELNRMFPADALYAFRAAR